MKSAIDALLNTLEKNPDIWSIRKEAARLLFDNSRYKEAAEIVWTAPEIPAVDLEIAFAARVVSRAQPRRAIRLLNHVMEKAVGNPAKLLALANALMHYGMVMQHFMLWLDDSQRLWGDWAKDDQQMNELPWVKRDEKKGEDYEKMMSGLTTPIKVPGLNESTAEHLLNEYYRQVPIRDAEVTGPPAVTVPLDQLNPDDVIHNNALGAAITKPKGSGSRTFKKPQPMACPDMTPVKKEFPASAVKPSPLVKEKAVIKAVESVVPVVKTSEPPKTVGLTQAAPSPQVVEIFKTEAKSENTKDEISQTPRLIVGDLGDDSTKPKLLF